MQTHTRTYGIELEDEAIHLLYPEISQDDAQALHSKCDDILNPLKSSPGFATLVSDPRLRATTYLALYALTIKGDYVETGVYQGGTASILMKVLIDAGSSKKFYACDSFEGFPEVQEQDGNSKFGIAGSKGDLQSSQATFENNLNNWNVHNSSILRTVKGYFEDTLKTLETEEIAFLRLDGDIYSATLTALVSDLL